MRLLLDTHVLLWWAASEPLDSVRDAIADPAARVFVSPVSIWEAEIKMTRGKLTVDGDLIEASRGSGFAELPVTFDHALVAGRLPLHHQDPFDRLLIAQAQVEGLTIVTRDAAFSAYDVPVLAA